MKNFLAVLSLLAVCLATLPSAHAWEAKGDYSTVTASAGAATLSKSAGLVTTEALTTAAAATYTLTLTNTRIAATSIVVAAVDANSSTGLPVITSIAPGAGSVVIKVTNLHASAAFNAALKIRFAILKQ